MSPEIIDKIYVKHLDGPLFFGFTSHFQAMTEALKDVELVIIRMELVPYIDQSGVYAMEDTITDLESKNIMVVMTGLQDQPLAMLRNLNVIPSLVPETYLFATFSSCTKWMKYIFLDSEDGLKQIIADIKETKKTKVDLRM